MRRLSKETTVAIQPVVPDPRPSLAAEIALEDAASKGPWTAAKSEDCQEPYVVFGGGTSVVHSPWNRPSEAANMQFIAHARTSAPAAWRLLQRIRELAADPYADYTKHIVDLIDAEFAP